MSKQQEKPSEMRRCLVPRWKYIPANETDIRATFRRFGWFPIVRTTK